MWPSGNQPFGPNNVPLLTGLSSVDAHTPVPVAVDPNTGEVLVSAAGTISPTAILSGKKTVTTAGTPVNIASNQCQAVTIKALIANTGTIYVGPSSVTSANGHQLDPGESVSFDIANTNAVWLDAAVNGEGVTWLAVK